VKINVVRQGFRKLSSQTYGQTDTLEIIYHAVSRVVNKTYLLKLTAINSR